MPILMILLATLKAHPERVLQLVSALLALFKDAPNVFVELMPDGPAKDYAKAHNAETVEAVRSVIDALASHPELLTALIRQFAK